MNVSVLCTVGANLQAGVVNLAAFSLEKITIHMDCNSWIISKGLVVLFVLVICCHDLVHFGWTCFFRFEVDEKNWFIYCTSGLVV